MNIVEKVASGLRRMKAKPVAFLFCDQECQSDHQWTWDQPTILGFPVLHSHNVHNTTTDEGVPFIPLFNQNDCYGAEIRRFNDGYINGDPPKPVSEVIRDLARFSI